MVQAEQQAREEIDRLLTAAVVEFKKAGVTLTGVETRFTSGLDPDPRSRPVFALHEPEHEMRLAWEVRP